MTISAVPSEIRIFATIAEQGSFIGAARLLRIPKTTVSRKIEELEARLGVRLFQRTTRKLALTEPGHVFYSHCAGILASIENAETAVGHLTVAPRGTVRVTTPFSFAVYALAPVMHEFIDRFPEVRIELLVRNEITDLIAEHIDVAVRISTLNDSSLISRALGAARSVLVASPTYLMQAGTPATLAELGQHRTLVLTRQRQNGAGHGWLLARATTNPRGRLSAAAAAIAGAGEFVNVRPVLTANAAEPLVQAAITGLGIACLPTTLVDAALASGALTRVLPEWATSAVPLQVLYPSRLGLQPKARVFVDFLIEKFSTPAGNLS